MADQRVPVPASRLQPSTAADAARRAKSYNRPAWLRYVVAVVAVAAATAVRWPLDAVSGPRGVFTFYCLAVMVASLARESAGKDA